MEKTIPMPSVVFQKIFTELSTLFSEIDEASLAPFIQALQRGRRLFFYGAGRSGLAVKMAAMRFMHLGLEAHAVGDVTCPAIGEGDVLLVASGSGRTPGILSAAQQAQAVGSLFEQATVLLLDALFHLLWKMSAQPAEVLWARHANME